MLVGGRPLGMSARRVVKQDRRLRGLAGECRYLAPADRQGHRKCRIHARRPLGCRLYPTGPNDVLVEGCGLLDE